MQAVVHSRLNGHGYLRDVDSALQDIPLERSVLGRLLCRQATPDQRCDLLAKMIARLTPEVFSRPAHRIIMGEIIRHAEETGDAGDAVMIERRLMARPAAWAEIDGDGGYVSTLADAEPVAWVGDGQIDRLLDLSRKRKLLSKARTLIEIVADPNAALSDAVDYADGLTARLDPEGMDGEVLGETMTTAELFDRAKPPNFLVRNVITSGTLTVWSAPEKAWKTTLAVMLALVVTGHGKFLSLYEPVGTGPVLFFSGESGAWPLRSMMTRILEWMFPGDVYFGGEPISLKPAPAAIPIFWGGDPPDLGNPASLSALKRLVTDLGVKLLILDPSQALFGSISEDVKNDFAMRQYMKKLQSLARETGCAVVMLHHFRQHVPPGFPKRSDSSYGAMMKFTDTWILANAREAPTGEEPPGSGSLWITWGSRDGFGGSHAIDISEGTNETGRHFDLTVSDVGAALDQLAGKQAERKGQATKAVREATSDKRRTEIRKALSGRVTAVNRETLAGVVGVSRQCLTPTIDAMLDEGELVEVPRQYGNHGKVCWATGLALPENSETITAEAIKRGWKEDKEPTGATGVTGVNPTPVTTVGTEGDATVVTAP